MSSDALISSVEGLGKRISVLESRLVGRGFHFDHPKEVFPGPERNAQRVIDRIEEEVGAVPRALKLFWLRVGSVDFSGHHLDWRGCEYLDQLIVFPPSVALEELDDFLADREERLRCNFPYAIPIAPDMLHKADVSGGPPYTLAIPATKDDPPLENAVPSTSFLGHITHALKYAGFPGLAEYAVHTWPLADLTRNDG